MYTHWLHCFLLPNSSVTFSLPSLTVLFLKKDEEAKLDVAQASPVMPCGNRLATGSFSHPACVAAAVSSFLWLRTCSGGGRRAGNTCWVACLPFLSLLLSLHRICHCLFFHLYPLSPPPPPPHASTPFSTVWLYSSISPSLLPRVPVLPNHRCDSKHSLRCWSTLHTVMCHLRITQDVVGMTVLGWHVSPEDIMFTLFVFTGKINPHHA